MMQPHVKEVTDEQFLDVVLEGSKQQPVLVDFWAGWCEPCKQLGPVLEQLATEYAGGFLLAKVDTDRSPVVAGQLGVQSIPAVYLFKDGRPVDRFVGVLPADEIRRFLAPHVGIAQAGEEDGEQADAPDEAAETARAELLELCEQADGSGDDPLAPRYLAALTLAKEERYEESLEQLLALVEENKAWRDGAARKAMIKIFEVIGNRSELADAYRDRLSLLLY